MRAPENRNDVQEPNAGKPNDLAACVPEVVKKPGEPKASFEEPAEFAPEIEEDEDRDADESSTSKKKKKAPKADSQVKRLVAMATDIDLFHTADKEAFANVHIGGHRETHSLRRGNEFRLFLRRLYYQGTGTPPGAQSVTDAVAQLEAAALFDGREAAVHVRVGGHEENIYIDLGDRTGQAVEVSPRGWAIMPEPPVYFRRPRGAAPLPAPVSGGSITPLRKFVNVGDDQQWHLMVAWLVAALNPTGPYPVLALQGGQGAAKSTSAKMLRALIDPFKPALRRLPRNERDLAIAARNQHVLSFDNLSGVLDWMSDALCSIATGGGMATRELCTDSDEALFDICRPIMLNGIDKIATRPDLADRALLITLPDIPDGARRDEKELWNEFYDARPGILGALCEGLCTALRNLPGTRLPFLPRMADFARIATAAEPAFGWKKGTFFRAYTGNQAELIEQSLEENMVAQALISLLAAEPGGWFTGTASNLLKRLNHGASDEVKYRKEWPKLPNQLSAALRRIIVPLRAVGIQVENDRTGQERLIKIRRVELTSRVLPGTATADDGDDGDIVTPSPDTVTNDQSSPRDEADQDGQDVGDDGRDDRDGYWTTLRTERLRLGTINTRSVRSGSGKLSKSEDEKGPECDPDTTGGEGPDSEHDDPADDGFIWEPNSPADDGCVWYPEDINGEDLE